MSEEVQETPNTGVDDTEVVPQDDEDLTIDDYKQIVSKLRKEAGNRRVKSKEIQAQLDEYNNWKKSQMSEVERANAEKAELEAELNSYRKEKLQSKVAEKAGLDAEFTDLINGDTEEEMLAHAKRLKERLGPRAATAKDTRPGSRGKPVGADAGDSVNDWFRNLYASGS